MAYLHASTKRHPPSSLSINLTAIPDGKTAEVTTTNTVKVSAARQAKHQHSRSRQRLSLHTHTHINRSAVKQLQQTVRLQSLPQIQQFVWEKHQNF